MRYFVVFLMLFSIGMFAMGCGDDTKPEKKPAVEKKNGPEPEPKVDPEPDPDAPTP